MAWTVPNSDVEIYKGVPMDINYNNCIFFANSTDRDNYFTNPTAGDPVVKIGTFSRVTYVRGNAIIINGTIGDYFNANYMRFRNTSYQNRWFYAFVTAVEYVNDNAVRLTWELDVITTWIHSVTFLPSYVERQHTDNDTLFSSLTDEGLECGEYVRQGSALTPFSTDSTGIYAIMGVSRYISGTHQFSIRSSYCYGMPSMITYYVIRSPAELLAIYAYYRAYGNTEDILFLIPLPGRMLGTAANYNQDAEGHYYLKDEATIITTNATRTMPNASTSFLGQSASLGYVPRNKKLFNAPFFKFVVTDHEGQTTEYQPQLFYDGDNTTARPYSASWQISLAINEIPQAIIKPRYYRGDGSYGSNDIMICAPYSQQPVVTDSFAAFMALNSAQIANQYNILASTRDYTAAAGAWATATANLQAEQAMLGTVQGKIDYGANALGLGTGGARSTPATSGAASTPVTDASVAASSDRPSHGGISGPPRPSLVPGQSYTHQQLQYVTNRQREIDAQQKQARARSEHLAERDRIYAMLDAGQVGAVLGEIVGVNSGAIDKVISGARQAEMDLTAAGQRAALAQRAAGAAAMQEAYNNDQARLAIQGLNAKVQDARTISPGVRGTNNPNTMLAYNIKGPSFYYYTITAEYARIIDSYFDLYGYAVRRVQIPRRHVRQNWTYVKTIKCTIRANLDRPSMQQIINVFDHGVTFWTSFATFGDYSQPNPTLT